MLHPPRCAGDGDDQCRERWVTVHRRRRLGLCLCVGQGPDERVTDRPGHRPSPGARLHVGDRPLVHHGVHDGLCDGHGPRRRDHFRPRPRLHLDLRHAARTQLTVRTDGNGAAAFDPSSLTPAFADESCVAASQPPPSTRASPRTYTAARISPGALERHHQRQKLGLRQFPGSTLPLPDGEQRQHRSSPAKNLTNPLPAAVPMPARALPRRPR